MELAQLLRNEGKEEGILEGLNKEKSLLLRQIRRRFNEHTGFQAQPKINAIQSADKLEIIGDLIIDLSDGDEFLRKLEAITSG